MEVFVNDELLTVTDSATIADVLQLAGVNAANGVALAVNNQVVAKACWSQTSVAAGDKLVIIRATQGG
jgi:sulfur carrier protein